LTAMDGLGMVHPRLTATPHRPKRNSV
jgi:hypothetical protein